MAPDDRDEEEGGVAATEETRDRSDVESGLTLRTDAMAPTRKVRPGAISGEAALALRASLLQRWAVVAALQQGDVDDADRRGRGQSFDSQARTLYRPARSAQVGQSITWLKKSWALLPPCLCAS